MTDEEIEKEIREEYVNAGATLEYGFDPVSVSFLLSKLDQARAELAHVDAVLARRPALDDEPDRCSKIAKAIRVAGEADAALAQLDRLREEVEQATAWAERYEAQRNELRAFMKRICEMRTASDCEDVARQALEATRPTPGGAT